MSFNLNVEQALNAIAQFVQDQNGNISQLSLSTENVGIGTSDPKAKLHVSSGAITIDNPGEGAVLLFLGIERHWQLRQFGAGAESALELASVGGGGNKNFIISTNGKVGIGTNDPKAKLHVSGGAINIDNPGEGAVLLFLGIERHWQLRQLGAGAESALELASVGGGGNKNFIISTAGNVGIGTTSPEEKLTVEGNIMATGDVRLAGADCAEDFDVDELTELEYGMVMIIGEEGTLYQCNQAYDRRVAGVLSGAGDYRPGILLGKQASKKKNLPLALTGKVYCKVDANYTPIEMGDLLTTSPTPGHAMKASDPSRAFGAVIGKALRPLAEGTGLVPILVALQ